MGKNFLWLVMVLLSAACTFSVVSPADTLNDPKKVAKLADEIAALQKRVPLKSPVEIVVFNPNIYGWWQGNPRTRCIYILDRGKGQNIKTLRHEWEHARQHDAGEPYDEPKAYKAEDP